MPSIDKQLYVKTSSMRPTLDPETKQLNVSGVGGSPTHSSNLLLYRFCQSTYINVNASDVINFSISTPASEAAGATFFLSQRRWFIRSVHFQMTQ